MSSTSQAASACPHVCTKQRGLNNVRLRCSPVLLVARHYISTRMSAFPKQSRGAFCAVPV